MQETQFLGISSSGLISPTKSQKSIYVTNCHTLTEDSPCIRLYSQPPPRASYTHTNTHTHTHTHSPTHIYFKRTRVNIFCIRIYYICIVKYLCKILSILFITFKNFLSQVLQAGETSRSQKQGFNNRQYQNGNRT